MRKPILGRTRTHVATRHALIAPDGHVPSVLPGGENMTCFTLISPGMGAKLVQLLLVFSEKGKLPSSPDDQGIESTFYVMEGACHVTVSGRRELLRAGAYAFAPADTAWVIEAEYPETRVTVFQKRFEPRSDLSKPGVIFGNAKDVEAMPFLGDPDVLLKTLLPEDPIFDMAVNLLTFQPGARLPFVETHVMEHGLILLDGEGVYRLEDAWYPVTAGDAIWMSPYCPQWFVAMGRRPVTYLYYKDVNRAPVL